MSYVRHHDVARLLPHTLVSNVPHYDVARLPPHTLVCCVPHRRGARLQSRTLTSWGSATIRLIPLPSTTNGMLARRHSLPHACSVGGGTPCDLGSSKWASGVSLWNSSSSHGCAHSDVRARLPSCLPRTCLPRTCRLVSVCLTPVCLVSVARPRSQGL
eukprot:351827-Chlamydomonas_euryale.AAC.1